MTIAKPYSSIEKVRVVDQRGPWKTKSGGELTVVGSWDFGQAEELLSYPADELAKLPRDIRGLRIYSVAHLPLGRTGASEFHRVRQETVFVMKGQVKWTCEDISGKTREIDLTAQQGVYNPPYILHTYTVLEEDSHLVVLANTTFDPDDPNTHDTFPVEEFRRLQKAT